MAIIRSKIARQLLAEGGAPRKPFSNGGFDEADVEAGLATESMSDFTSDNYGEDFQGSSFGSNRGDMGSPPGGNFDDIDFSNVTARDLRNISIRPDGTSDAGSIFDFLPTSIIRRADEKFIGPFRDKSNLARRTEFLRREGLIGPGEEDEKYSDTFLKSPAGLEMLRNMGYTTIQDVINKGEGGDNEPVRKLRAPITEKKEKPKSEFDDILKFYGARFAKGGTTGDSYGEDIGAAYGTAGITDAGGPEGDGGDEPPIVRGGGTEPPMLSGGRGIDVGALERQGLTPAEIATVFNDYYGLDTGPRVAGPLGQAGLGALSTPAPAPLMGQQVPGGLLGVEKGTTGTKGTQPTGFNVKDVQPTSGYGGKKDQETGKALADFLKEAGPDFLEAAGVMKKSLEPYGGPKFEDGGEVRQEYGLGSIVKKIGRTVKKVAKSPIGKLALIGGLGYLGATKTGFGADLLTSFSKLDPIKKALLIGGAGLSLSPFAMQDEEEEKLPTVANTDPEMTKFIDFYGGPRRFAAEGGMMEQDEMLDLDGNEMDLRGGGFVPLGEYEKKDDVPARLSKNEFVFTADAVRAAGGGSVDKGADVMYKTMKTLENKVA